MATRNVDVTPDPANIVAALGLIIGSTYSLQNVDPSARIFLRQAAVKPTGGALRGYVIAPFSAASITPETNVGIWLWTDRADGAKAVLDSAA